MLHGCSYVWAPDKDDVSEEILMDGKRKEK